MGDRIKKLLKQGTAPGCLLVLALFSFDCMNKPLAPVAPSWETQLTAPVSAKSYSLADLVNKDSSLISIAPGGTQLLYATTFQADPTYVGARLSFSPISASSGIQLGVFTVPASSYALPIEFPPQFPRGTTTVIPPGQFTLQPLPGTLPGLDSVSFQSGTVELHLRNNLPVDVTVMSPITLTDAGGKACGSFDFSGSNPIKRGTEAVAVMNLAGVFLTHSISLAGVVLSEPGSGGPVPIPADSLMVGILVPKNPVVQSAIVTSLPAQLAAANVTRALAIRDSNLVKDLTVKSGTMTIHFQSNLPVNAALSYSISELLTPAGGIYTDNINLPARGSFDRTFDLASYRLHSPDGNYISALDVTGSIALSQVNGAGAVKVQSTDDVSFAVSTTAIVADSVTGVLKPTWVGVNAVLPVNLGDLSKKFRGQVNIPAANLRILPQSTIRFPLQLALKLEAESNRGQLLSEMDVPATTTATGGSLQPIDFVPGDVGRFLSSISGQLPDSLRVKGNILVNPNYDVSLPQSVGSNSWFGGQVQVSFPLTCSLTGGQFADTAKIGDTTGTGQGHTIIDGKTAGEINSIKLHVVIDNAIPLKIALKLLLLDRAGRAVMSLPQSTGDSITIPAPAAPGGIVVTPAHAERIIQLAGTEVGLFNGASLIAYSLGISTSGTDAVRFESTQTIRLRVWAEFSYQVNK